MNDFLIPHPLFYHTVQVIKTPPLLMAGHFYTQANFGQKLTQLLPIPITSPVSFISGPSESSAPLSFVKGKTELFQTYIFKCFWLTKGFCVKSTFLYLS